jgi:hypothetical protein
MVRNILAVIAGIVVGSVVNMGLINLGHAIIPPPAGVDLSTMESLAATIHLFEPKHYIFVFLAHALGPLVGTFVAMLIAVSHKMKIAIGLGVFFLLGGIAANVMIPAPMWYRALDIIVAYVPMALIGAKLGGAGKSS